LRALLNSKNIPPLKSYFMSADVKGFFVKYKPLEKTALAEIHKIHQLFITSWPKDIRGERGFIVMRIDSSKSRSAS
jgi:hypothetical protein